MPTTSSSENKLSLLFRSAQLVRCGVILFIALALWLLAPLSRAAGRQQIPLTNGWKFALQPAGSGFAEPAFDDSHWASITLPHTWNAFDGQDGGHNYVRGDGWYRTTFATDQAWAGRRVFIQFDGANRVTEIWLNGRRVGDHRGGFARFRFDLTDLLQSSETNVLAVRVNNETNGLIPLSADFTFFGGLYRPVSLVVVDPVHIALGDFGSPGVYLTPRVLSADRAEVTVRTLLESSSAAGKYRLRVVVRNAGDVVVAEDFTAVSFDRAHPTSISQTLRIPQPHLWQGRSDPYLYRVTIELWQAGAVVDAVEQPLGLRNFAVDPSRGFLLNGRPYALHGVNRHQDRQDRGWAITRREHREDLTLIEEVGATAIRLCHYEQDEYVYQLADAEGMILWTEVPFVNEAVSPNPDFADNAVQQLRELIRQNYNHPSILCWGVGNETEKKHLKAADVLIARLHAVAKEEDPGRYTTYASNHADDDPRNFHTDLLGYNRYFGWYSRDYAQLGPWLDTWHAQHPTRPLGISEYGAGGSIYQHEQNPPARPRTQAKGPWHPEEWQNDYHEHIWLALKARPYLWATFIWNMFDFAADNRGEGDTAGRNDKGLVTYDRRTRKDAFFWYQANWTDAPMIHIASARDSLRLEPVTAVKIYSNCDAVELSLNGASLGSRTSADHRFIWSDVTLQPGPNRLSALGTKGAAQVSDACAWTLTTGVPYRPASDPPNPMK